MAIDVDAYEPAPADLTLKQVHVYVRNGERYPVNPGVLLPYCGNVFDGCRLANHSTRYFLHGGEQTLQSALVNFATEFGGPLDQQETKFLPKDVGVGVCSPTQLTDRGFLSANLFGTALRKIYVDKLKFLPKNLTRDEYYLRSTDTSRTRDTVFRIMIALFHQSTRQWSLPYLEPASSEWMSQSTGHQPVASMQFNSIGPIHVRTEETEDLRINHTCQKYNILQHFWERAASQEWSARLEDLQPRLSKYNRGNRFRLTDRERPLWHLLDYVKFAQAHDTPSPPMFDDPKVMRTLERAVLTQVLGGYNNKEMRTLGIGRMLSDLRYTMAQKIKFGTMDPLKLRLFGTHDTTLASALIALGVYDGHWVDFTASLSFELYAGKASEESAHDTTRTNMLASPEDVSSNSATAAEHPLLAPHYVRTIYQNKALSLPGCAESAKHYPSHPELCTFDAFSDIVQASTPRNWVEECQTLKPGRPDFNQPPVFVDGELFFPNK